jgi:hypothetical protein
MVVTFISFLISALLIPLIIHYCEIRGMYDRVNDRKIHNGNISRLGGLAIFLGFLLPYSYILFKNYTVTFNPYIYTSAMMLAFLTGFADDCFHVRARYKLVLQIACGILVAMSGLQIQKITVLSGLIFPSGRCLRVYSVLGGSVHERSQPPRWDGRPGVGDRLHRNAFHFYHIRPPRQRRFGHNVGTSGRGHSGLLHLQLSPRKNIHG